MTGRRKPSASFLLLKTERKDKKMEKEKQKLQHGGARPGAGRKPSGKKKIYKTLSISLLPEEWEQLDAMRGDMSRSSYIAAKLGLRTAGR